MPSPLNAVTEFRIVVHRLLASNEHAMLLCRGNLYAVCRTQPERSLAIAENYECPEQGILTAPLNLRGLLDLLSWVDKSTADKRFRELINRCGVPSLHLAAVPS